MKITSKIFNEIFDFFCGDWRVFWGVTLTIILVELLNHIKLLNAIKPLSGIIFVIGITLSFVFAVKREIQQ